MGEWESGREGERERGREGEIEMKEKERRVAGEREGVRRCECGTSDMEANTVLARGLFSLATHLLAAVRCKAEGTRLLLPDLLHSRAEQRKAGQGSARQIRGRAERDVMCIARAAGRDGVEEAARSAAIFQRQLAAVENGPICLRERASV